MNIYHSESDLDQHYRNSGCQDLAHLKKNGFFRRLASAVVGECVGLLCLVVGMVCYRKGQ